MRSPEEGLHRSPESAGKATGNRHEAVSGLYDGISGCYGPANSFLTLGLDSYWRRKAAGILKKARHGNIKILDVCCGTGDFSFRLAKAYGPGAEITAVDLNEKMLSRAAERGFGAKFLLADAAELPFPDESFDAVTLSFAARNVAADREEFPLILGEFRRVLAKGGVFLNLETTVPQNFILRNLMRLHVRTTVALLNLALPQEKTPYAFLKNTIFGFYRAGELENILRETGFGRVEHEILCPGAVAVHLGYKT